MFLEGEALQLTSGLDFLSIQAYRLWMEHPSRGKVKRKIQRRLKLRIIRDARVALPLSGVLRGILGKPFRDRWHFHLEIARDRKIQDGGRA